jgi:acyl dehydratase
LTPVPITPEHAGRSYPATAPYEVSAAKIAEFARALGDDNPAYFSRTPLAPPTFVFVLASAAWDAMFADEELGLALQRVVHGDQRFTYERLLRAGDEVQARLRIDKVRSRGATDIVSCSVRIETIDGELVCTAESTFAHTREEAA